MKATEPIPSPPPLRANEAQVKRGGDLYGRTCAICHGQQVIGGVKDLRHLTAQTHAEFDDIVLRGTRKDKGMAGFADILTEQDAHAIHDYIIARANEDWARMARRTDLKTRAAMDTGAPLRRPRRVSSGFAAVATVVTVLSLAVAASVACGAPSNSVAPVIAQDPPLAVAAEVDGVRLRRPDEGNNTGQWMSYGRTWGEQRFSPLHQIDVSSVGRLGLSWYADLDTYRGIEGTPLEVDGVLITSPCGTS